MQQTKNYQLNKIDVDDNFSPGPLNENMEKVDSALAALAGADKALDSRVTVLEGHKIAIGSYTGTGATQSIAVGFRPKVVFCQLIPRINSECFVATDLGGFATLTDSGFTLTTEGYPNSPKVLFMFIAIK